MHDSTVGPSFFQSFNNFPGAQYILQVPVATGNLSNAVAYAQSAWQEVADSIRAIELGNEPDLYANPPSPQAYVAQQLQFENAIMGNISDFPTRPIFQASDPAIAENYNP